MDIGHRLFLTSYPSGLPRCDKITTLAPLLTKKRMVGSSFFILVASRIFPPSSSGTLKSTLSKTTLPFKFTRSLIVLFILSPIFLFYNFLKIIQNYLLNNSFKMFKLFSTESLVASSSLTLDEPSTPLAYHKKCFLRYNVSQASS